MGRYLAIDYGTKRCGIAVTDPMKMIVSGTEVVASHELMTYLKDYIAREEVECVVLGKALKEDASPSSNLIHTERFAQAFKKNFPHLPLHWLDERYSSKIAVQTMVEGGMKKKERAKKGNIDKLSAAIILQSYLDMENNSQP